MQVVKNVHQRLKKELRKFRNSLFAPACEEEYNKGADGKIRCRKNGTGRQPCRTRQNLHWRHHLKSFLLKKPVDKITINDLTEDCGISRMAFYYHFKDIYDLIEWACLEDGKRALADKKTYSTWSEGLEQIFEAVLENKPFILNVYHSVSQKKIESYLYKLTYDLLADVVEEECRDAAVSGEDKALIAEFYKYGFVGMMLHWIDGGMKADYRELVQRLSTMLRGSILNAARNFEQKQSASLAKEPE